MRRREDTILATQFANVGYARLPGIVSQAQLEPLKATLVAVFSDIFPEARSQLAESFDNPIFDTLVIDKRLKSKEAFGRFYDIIQTNIAVNRLFHDAKLLEAVAMFLDCSVERLAWSGSLLRIDVPGDKRNTLGWHQDHHYLPYNEKGRGIVVTLAISDAWKEMGALNIIEESHRLGIVVPVKSNNDRFSTQQLNVCKDEIDSKKIKCIETQSGDALFLDMRTFHRSGHNSSTKVRWSCIMRFHNSLDTGFLPFRRIQSVIT